MKKIALVKLMERSRVRKGLKPNLETSAFKSSYRERMPVLLLTHQVLNKKLRNYEYEFSRIL